MEFRVTKSNSKAKRTNFNDQWHSRYGVKSLQVSIIYVHAFIPNTLEKELLKS